MPGWVIARDEPTAPDVVRLLQAHLDHAHALSPPEHVYALGATALAQPDIALFGARRDGLLLAVGALRELDPAHGEIKSMHTAAAARRNGIGRAMLDHLLSVARDRGYRRVSLETGIMDGFAPARQLYESVGFVRCPPFGDYHESPHGICMTLELA